MMLFISGPVLVLVSGLSPAPFLRWLRSGTRSLDVVERFEMNSRLQRLREELEAEYRRNLDGYKKEFRVCDSKFCV